METPTSPSSPFGVLLSDDLLFGSRITATARGLGLTMRSARNVEGLQAQVQQQPPACVILDLANPTLRINELLPWLRELFPGGLRVIAYGSHVDTATLKAAREAGCDIVLPRSKFTEDLVMNLPAWFGRDEPGKVPRSPEARG